MVSAIERREVVDLIVDFQRAQAGGNTFIRARRKLTRIRVSGKNPAEIALLTQLFYLQY